MVKHRGLNLKKFIFALPWELFEAYFDQLNAQNRPGLWGWLDPSVLFNFLEDETNAEAAAAILEDFRRINDLAPYLPFLLYAYARAGLTWNEDESGEAGAMRLFLQDREAFEYAWTLYLLQKSPMRQSEYFFPAGSLDPTAEQRDKLRAYVSGHFSSIKHGEQCMVSLFRDGSKLYVRVARGRKITTIARWRDQEIAVESFRPVAEDVLAYDSERAYLCLYGGVARDRELYIHALAEYIAENPALAETALSTPVISLEPFKSGTFSFSGNSAIKRIWLVGVEFIDDFGTRQSLEGMRLQMSLETQKLSLQAIDLSKVQIRLTLQPEGAKKSWDCVINLEAPRFNDLSQKDHTGIIESYLRHQGVRLI